MEVPKSTPTAALFLELGSLPIQYEIEKRQLVFLKKILDRQNDDPVKRNWANIVHELRSEYNLPLSDKNVCYTTYDTWKRIVNDRIKHVAFLSLIEMCSANKKTCFLSYSKLMRAPCLSKLNQKLLAWFSEQELVFMTSKTILRESMIVI